MTAKSMLMLPQGLRLGDRALICPSLLRHCVNTLNYSKIAVLSNGMLKHVRSLKIVVLLKITISINTRQLA